MSNKIDLDLRDFKVLVLSSKEIYEKTYSDLEYSESIERLRRNLESDAEQWFRFYASVSLMISAEGRYPREVHHALRLMHHGLKVSDEFVAEVTKGFSVYVTAMKALQDMIESGD